jgi:hypothetical protein
MTLPKGYPDPKLKEISTDFARHLMPSAKGKALWKAFKRKSRRVWWWVGYGGALVREKKMTEWGCRRKGEKEVQVLGH